MTLWSFPRTLGMNWNKFSQEQRKEFVGLFKTILKDAYADKIIAYTNEQVTFPKEVPISDNMVEVQSVVAAKSGNVSINYRVIKKDGDWKVYDVVIEGVSLIEITAPSSGNPRRQSAGDPARYPA